MSNEEASVEENKAAIKRDLQRIGFLNVGVLIALPCMFFFTELPIELLIILFLATQQLYNYLQNQFIFKFTNSGFYYIT